MKKNNLIINLQDITFGYPERANFFDNLNLNLFKGEKIGLMAPNGSGKTTLFYIIMGLLKPLSGNIEIFGEKIEQEKDFEQVRKKIGLLFQDADDQLFSPTVIEDVAFGPLNLGKSKEEAIAVSRKILNDLGLEGFEDRINFKLSGGEKSLVAFATILAMEPEVLLLDEPTTGLDEKTKEILIDVLNQSEFSYIMISHDADFIASTTDKIYTLKNGKILTDKDVYVHSHIHAHPHDDEHSHELGYFHGKGHDHGKDNKYAHSDYNFDYGKEYHHEYNNE